jgi:general secretion pathway protein I
VRGRRGFTLLEVLVSIAILGLALTAILSAQAGAVSGTAHAKNMSVAVGLVRCKMAEIEDQLRVEGFQESGPEGSGPCCNETEFAGFSCSWTVEKPTFPDPELGELDLDAQLDTSAVSKLAGAATAIPEGGNISDVTQSLAGDEDVAALAAGGVGGIASMVMSLVYPDMKLAFEAGVRRVTVTATWAEGSKTYDLVVAQWVTQAIPGMLGDTDDLEAAASGQGSGPGGTGSGSGSTGSGSPAGGKTGGPSTGLGGMR